MEYSALDFYDDGLVILCFDTRRLLVSTRLTTRMRNEINDFVYLAYSDSLIEYETIFCTLGRHCFDFLNGWRFIDESSAKESMMVSDDYGIWWDVQAIKDFVGELESK